jgi:hypothetical protein
MKKYKVASYGVGGVHTAEFESEHRANSKKWLEQVREIERETGYSFSRYYYTSKSGYLEERFIKF